MKVSNVTFLNLKTQKFSEARKSPFIRLETLAAVEFFTSSSNSSQVGGEGLSRPSSLYVTRQSKAKLLGLRVTLATKK